MTRPTKLSGILSGTFGIITLIFALTTADWSNRDDVVLSVLFSLVLMGLVFGITFGFAYTSEKHRQSPKSAKQNDSAGGLAVLFVIGLGAYGMYATDWGFSKGQITDYALKCTSDDYINNRCDGSYAQGPVTVYTVNTDQ